MMQQAAAATAFSVSVTVNPAPPKSDSNTAPAAPVVDRPRAPVAAFAASHNPPDTDIRYFSRCASGKKRARAPGGASGAGCADGAWTFSLERLLAVAHALIADARGVEASKAVGHSDLLLTGVAALERAHLLLRVEDPAAGGTPVYAANVSARHAAAISLSLNLGLEKFLHS